MKRLNLKKFFEGNESLISIYRATYSNQRRCDYTLAEMIVNNCDPKKRYEKQLISYAIVLANSCLAGQYATFNSVLDLMRAYRLSLETI